MEQASKLRYLSRNMSILGIQSGLDFRPRSYAWSTNYAVAIKQDIIVRTSLTTIFYYSIRTLDFEITTRASWTVLKTWSIASISDPSGWMDSEEKHAGAARVFRYRGSAEAAERSTQLETFRSAVDFVFVLSRRHSGAAQKGPRL